MSKTKLKKYLQNLTHDQIMEVVLDLYDARKDAKEYLEFFMNPDVKAELEKTKKSVLRNYFTPQGRTRSRVSTKTGSDIVADFIRLDTDPEHVADLLLYHVEVMMSRLVLRHLVRETAWTTVVNQFRKALDYIAAYNLLPRYERRIEKILEYAENAPSYLRVEERMKQEFDEVFPQQKQNDEN
ncbi:MAG: hypothetical protein K2M10_01935 [Muribaculaceae bacterium]|nr:hypothetical protein [Muribaculaceae bacterium]MDE6298396.1 hypothetical protein [Muribaculaceae bacterium]